MTAPYPDTFKLKGLRQRLVDGLRREGITDEAVLAAINAVPRHAFVESAFAEKAYLDIPLPIGAEQTISQPYTVGYMTQALGLQPGGRVLEVGTGSGYQAAVLHALGAQVYSIERVPELYHRTQKLLRALGYTVRLRLGDGTLGWPTHAPYQGIIVTAGGPAIPPALREQLAIGGRLVMPVGDRDVQQLIELTRLTETDYIQRTHPNFRFVPLIGKAGWEG